MRNTFGNKFRITIFGASHETVIGVYIQGIPVGYRLDEKELQKEIDRRKPTNKWTTPRKEKDIPDVSYYDDIMTITFRNENISDKDYTPFLDTPRPSHADYVQMHKYEHADILGGGISSGRMTLPIVAAGFVAKDIIKRYYAKDIKFKSEILSIGGEKVKSAQHKVLDYCYERGNSVGASIQCIVKNPPKFIGDPFFDGVESMISHLMFSIPGIKAIEFGDGVECATKYGSQRNDAFIDAEGHTRTNNEGGINGGITNGNDLIVRVHAKPTPSIASKQKTYNFKTNEMATLEINGRHDICFALRIPVVIESVIAICLLNGCLE